MLSYDILLDNFIVLLKDRGLKFTKPREVILKILYDNEGHFSPEEIHSLIRKNYSDLSVGIATIYRTMSLLEDAGLADSISFGKDGKLYELGIKKHHDHLICTSCGKIIEFVDDTIEYRQEEIAKEHNFQMSDHSMKIVGLCQECQKITQKKRSK